MRRRKTPFTTHSPLFWCVWDLYNWFYSLSLYILPMKVFHSISYLKKNVSKKLDVLLNTDWMTRSTVVPPSLTTTTEKERDDDYRSNNLKNFFRRRESSVFKRISNTRPTFSIFFRLFLLLIIIGAGASGTLKNITLLNSRTKSDDDKATKESEKSEIQLKKLWNIPAELNQWKSAHTNVAITLPKLEFS